MKVPPAAILGVLMLARRGSLVITFVDEVLMRILVVEAFAVPLSRLRIAKLTVALEPGKPLVGLTTRLSTIRSDWATTVGFTVTDTIAEFPDPAELETCTTYFTIVGVVIGVPLAFFVGAVKFTGLLVGLIVESSVVLAPPVPRQQPEANGSIGFQ